METIRLLLVDDEPDFLTLFGGRLAIRGLKVETAQSGDEALEKVHHDGFDVIILDVKMPGMDGITTLREIKRVDPDSEVILLTGHADTESAMQGMELGAYDYMLKPAVFDEVLMKVRDAVAERRRRLSRRMTGQVKG